MRRTEFVIHELVKARTVPTETPSRQNRSQSPQPQSLTLSMHQVHKIRHKHWSMKRKVGYNEVMQNDPLLTIQNAFQQNEKNEFQSPQEKKKTFFLIKPPKLHSQTAIKINTTQENFEEGVSKPKGITLESFVAPQRNPFIRAGSLEPNMVQSQEFVKLGTGISLMPKQAPTPTDSTFRITLRKPFLDTSLLAKKEVTNSMVNPGASQRQSHSMISHQPVSPGPRSISCNDKGATPSKRKMFAFNRVVEPNRRLISNLNTSSMTIIPSLDSDTSIFKATLYQPQNLFFRSTASGNASPLKKKSILIDMDGIICALINKVDCSFEIKPSSKPDPPFMLLRTDSMDFLCELRQNHNLYLVASKTTPELVLGKIIHKLTGFGVRGIILKGNAKEITDYREVLTTLGLNRQPTLYSVVALPQDVQASLTPDSDQHILRAVSDVFPSGLRVTHLFCSHLFMEIPANKYLDQNSGGEVGLITVNNKTLASILDGLKHPGNFRIGQKEAGRLLLQMLNDRMLAARQRGIDTILSDLGILQGKERTFPFPLTHEEYR